MEMAEWMDDLWGKDTKAGYRALQEMLALSQSCDAAYPYMGQFLEKLDSPNSYFRTRALALLSANAKWDTQGQIEGHIQEILAHITDEKPITARKCIQGLPALGRAKPSLRPAILAALGSANISHYPPSMRPLVEGDIRQAVRELEGQGNAGEPG